MYSYVAVPMCDDLFIHMQRVREMYIEIGRWLDEIDRQMYR